MNPIKTEPRIATEKKYHMGMKSLQMLAKAALNVQGPIPLKTRQQSDVY